VGVLPLPPFAIGVGAVIGPVLNKLVGGVTNVFVCALYTGVLGMSFTNWAINVFSKSVRGRASLLMIGVLICALPVVCMVGTNVPAGALAGVSGNIDEPPLYLLYSKYPPVPIMAAPTPIKMMVSAFISSLSSTSF